MGLNDRLLSMEDGLTKVVANKADSALKITRKKLVRVTLRP